MGGTTAKICLIDDGQPLMARTFEVDRQSRFMKGSGFPVRIPVIEMVEIGAGGGSIARVDEMAAHSGRAGERGLGAGAGLLWPRRHQADRDRCRSRARQDRSVDALPAARSRSIGRWLSAALQAVIGARAGHGRRAGGVRRRRDRRREHGECRARACGRARRCRGRSHAGRVRRRGAAACEPAG